MNFSYNASQPELLRGKGANAFFAEMPNFAILSISGEKNFAILSIFDKKNFANPKNCLFFSQWFSPYGIQKNKSGIIRAVHILPDSCSFLQGGQAD
ncbi:MAG: hypothetical protein IKO98_02475 [Bacteroidales bacterium]|nr:hypothetical protein [Bacteroidales bacterium]